MVLSHHVHTNTSLQDMLHVRLMRIERFAPKHHPDRLSFCLTVKGIFKPFMNNTSSESIAWNPLILFCWPRRWIVAGKLHTLYLASLYSNRDKTVVCDASCLRLRMYFISYEVPGTIGCRSTSKYSMVFSLQGISASSNCWLFRDSYALTISMQIGYLYTSFILTSF